MRASSATRRIRLSPPRGITRSMHCSMRSRCPTAPDSLRRLVAQHLQAGPPCQASRNNLHKAVFERSDSFPPRRMTALPLLITETPRPGHQGARFVDKRITPGHAHLLHLEPVGTDAALQNATYRIGRATTSPKPWAAADRRCGFNCNRSSVGPEIPDARALATSSLLAARISSVRSCSNSPTSVMERFFLALVASDRSRDAACACQPSSAQ